MTAPSAQKALTYSPLFVGAMPFQTPAQWVTSSTVMGIPAAWRALNIITNIVGTCAPKVLDGYKCIEDSFVTNPCPQYTPFEFYSEMAGEVVLHGNSVCYILRKPDGSVDQLLPLPTENMLIQFVNGRASYQWQGYDFSADEVLHVRGLTIPGVLRGVGVVEAHRRGLGIALDQMEYQSSGMRTGGVPSVVVKMPVNASNFTPALAEQVQTDWVNSFSGAKRMPAVVPQGMDISTLAFSPDDMQFLESKAMTVAEVAFMFGLSPHDLGASIAHGAAGALTYANISQKDADQVKCVTPLMSRIAQKMQTLEPRGTVRFVTAAQLQADTAERYATYTAAIAGGWLTVDEVREMEGLPPLASGIVGTELEEPYDSVTEDSQEVTA